MVIPKKILYCFYLSMPTSEGAKSIDARKLIGVERRQRKCSLTLADPHLEKLPEKRKSRQRKSKLSEQFDK